MRLPYGPGWEDPDWAPQATPPDESAAMKLEAEPVDMRPAVGSLAQFMDIVKRFATPHRRQVTLAARAPSGPTRRWVMAGTAGFVALAALPRGPGAAEPARATQADAEASTDEPAPPGGPRPSA
jgi:hypothetical protein